MSLREDKNRNFKIIIFITAALAAFLIFAALLAVLPMNYKPEILNKKNVDNKLEYKIKSGIKQDDRFITPVPKLENYLEGPIISPADPQKGGDMALVNIVYFSDYSCAYCHEQEKIVEKIFKEYGGQVRLIRKDYPDMKDRDSLAAARAARCAQFQDKFWPFHDRILAEQNDIYNDKLLLNIAVDSGLDKTKFLKCMNSEAPEKIIYDNIEEAGLLSISGIPFTYVNDRGFLGKLSFDDLKQLVEMELAREKK